MPIQNPNINTNIDTPTNNNPNRDMLVRLLQSGVDAGSRGALSAMDRRAMLDKTQLEHLLTQQGAQARGDQVEQLAGKFGDKFAIEVGKEGVKITPKDNTANADRADRNKRMAVSAITKDYNNLVGTAPKRAQAAQAVLEALDSGDTTSLGRIKANLPLLEGEQYKPTDQERELILQTTGEGMVGKLRNFLGMSQPALGAEQQNQLRSYAQSRLKDDQGTVERARGEINSRWANQLKSMPPDMIAELSGTFGQGNSKLSQQLLARPTPPPQEAPINMLKQALGTPSAAASEPVNSVPRGTPTQAASNPAPTPPPGMTYEQFKAWKVQNGR